MQLDHIIAYLRSLAPEDTAMANDPVGLLIEPAHPEISSVVVCLDATFQVAEFAIREGAQLIIAHHPLIYHPLKKLERSDPISSVAMDLVKAGIGLYAMHTNWDLAADGINDTLAIKLQLDHVQALPGEPIARIGHLKKPLTAAELVEHTSKSLRCSQTSTLRYPPFAHITKAISKVAVCGGAGASLIRHVLDCGVDAFITSDVRHDQFIDAAGRGFLLIDAGHEATEAPGMETLAILLQKAHPDLIVTFRPNWN
jgi:dinuclear metal center YbgI/SA1388 family protein